MTNISNEHHLQLMDAYLHNLKRLNKSDHTILNYRADLLKFFNWLEQNEQKKIEKVNGETIGRYKQYLSGENALTETALAHPQLIFILWFKWIIGKSLMKKRAPQSLLVQQAMSVSSRRRHLSTLKNFFQYLKELNEDHSKKFAVNPVKNKIHAITLKEIDVVPTKMLNKEEFRLIEEKTFRTKERLMLYLLYYGGLRLSELCYLKRSHFDHQNKLITFPRKGGSVHTLMIEKSELIFKNLDFYLSQTNFSTDFLFQNKDGSPYALKTFYNQVMKIIYRAPVSQGLTPHSFRKACATNLYMRTKDLLFVRDYLNHSDAKVTQTYIDKGTLMKLQRKLH